jgi:WD40 repeat protein
VGTAVNVVEIKGPCVLTAANDRTLRIHNLDTGKPRVFVGHDSGVMSAVWMGDEHLLSRHHDTHGLIVSGSATGEIFVWTWDGTDGKTTTQHTLKSFAAQILKSLIVATLYSKYTRALTSEFLPRAAAAWSVRTRGLCTT